MTTDTSSDRQKTDEIKGEGRRIADEARSRGEEVGRRAREEMGNVLDEARSRARHRADDQTHRTAGALRDMAHQLDSMADGADEEGTMIDLAHNGADRFRRLAEHLDDGGIDGLVDDVQTFARRRPGVYIAAGLGLGMMLGRVLRSSDTGALKQAMSDDAGMRGSGEHGESKPRGRSEPLAPEEVAQPVTTRREGPEAGRGI